MILAGRGSSRSFSADLKTTDTLSYSFTQLRQFLRSEHKQGNSKNRQQMSAAAVQRGSNLDLPSGRQNQIAGH